MLRIGTSEKLLLKYIVAKIDPTSSDRTSLEEVITDLYKIEQETGAYIYGFVKSREEDISNEDLWRDLHYLEARHLISIDKRNPHIEVSRYGKFMSMFYDLDEVMSGEVSKLTATH